MPTTIPEKPEDTTRGPQGTPGIPDRSQDGAIKPPIQDGDDTKNPNDPVPTPPLLPIGDPAGMA
ncbi:hypothetical protein [Allorhizobium taibaishanense]|uniref:Uncharacterized protein n=1 Tax=Allorhizobium taibaishanense TaxID=887144 RepID=A0A1Q8ZZP7_9HYPH|nr:hypothetical protein [Allorhizobium taibaishanense]OLP47812.1 hypothetical protein BJF91_03015 [Allorhizobium taibaishanense]